MFGWPLGKYYFKRLQPQTGPARVRTFARIPPLEAAVRNRPVQAREFAKDLHQTEEFTVCANAEKYLQTNARYICYSFFTSQICREAAAAVCAANGTSRGGTCPNVPHNLARGRQNATRPMYPPIYAIIYLIRTPRILVKNTQRVTDDTSQGQDRDHVGKSIIVRHGSASTANCSTHLKRAGDQPRSLHTPIKKSASYQLSAPCTAQTSKSISARHGEVKATVNHLYPISLTTSSWLRAHWAIHSMCFRFLLIVGQPRARSTQRSVITARFAAARASYP